jgi:hypothetical protein
MDYRKYSNSIIQNFKNNFINSDGLISRDYPPSSRSIFDNFDDIAPFLIHYGEIDFLQTQINLIHQRNNFDFLYFDNLIYSFKVDEFLGGLYSVYKKNKNSITKQVIENFLLFIDQKFIDDNKFYGVYDKNKDRTFKTEYPWSSGLLETFLEMKSDFPKLFNIVEEITKRWIKSEYFLKHGLFPYNFNKENYIQKFFKLKQIQTPFSKKETLKHRLKFIINDKVKTPSYSRVMKQNSTLIFTLIELYKINKSFEVKEAIEWWISNVIDKLIIDYTLYGEWYPINYLKDDNLTHTFIFIDIISEYLSFINPKDKKLQDLTIKLIDKRLEGLNDDFLIGVNLNKSICHMDTSLDFAISIRRFGEIIRNLNYINLSKKIILSILKFHKHNSAYATNYNINNGIVELNRNTIDPKYNGLLLKGIIALENFNTIIQENNYLHDLFKDR